MFLTRLISNHDHLFHFFCLYVRHSFYLFYLCLSTLLHLFFFFSTFFSILLHLSSSILFFSFFITCIFIFFSSTPETHKYQLRAYIYQARDLLAADTNGLSGLRALFTFQSSKSTFFLFHDESLSFPTT